MLKSALARRLASQGLAIRRAIGVALALIVGAGDPLAVQAQTTPPTPAVDVRAQNEALRVFDAWLGSVQAFDRIPAVSAAVAQGDKIVWSKGWGAIDAARTVPATPTTLYSICSISKLFTSVSLMQLWEAGKVRLDEPISSYLPWARLKPVEQDSLPITLRAILTHSAGLPREADYPYWTGPDYPFPTHDQIVAKFSQQSPLWPASQRFQYSNLGLTLVGETVAAISGEPYAEYAQTHVLTPLGLNDTHPFLPMKLYGTRLAVGWGAMERDGSRPLLRPFDAKGVTPAAGYTSTAEDLARFALWQFRLLRTGQAEVLKASTLREMQRVQFTDPDWRTTWGLGFSVNRHGEETYVGHGGDCPGYHTTLDLRPSTETAFVIMTTGAERPGGYALEGFKLLDKRKAYVAKGAAPARVDLEQYAGRYEGQPWAAEVLVAPWAGGLALLNLPSSAPSEALTLLKPKGGDVFRHLRDDGSEADEVRFERDKDGRVVRFVQFSNPRARLGPLDAKPVD